MVLSRFADLVVLFLILHVLKDVKATEREQCDPCFGLVEGAVKEQNSLLAELSSDLDRVTSGEDVSHDPALQAKLSHLMAQVQRTNKQCLSVYSARSLLNEQFPNLQDILEDVEKSSATVLHFLEKGRKFTENGQTHTNGTTLLVEGLDDALQSTRKLLESNGVTALNKAVRQAQHLGIQSEKMTGIARESRHYAEAHHMKANEIADVMADAIGNATLAFNIALQMIENQKNYTISIQSVDSSVPAVDVELALLAQLGSQSHQQAKEAYDRALDAFTEARSGLALIDANSIQLTASQLKAESDQISAELDLLFETDGAFLDNLTTEKINISKHFERLRVFQNTVVQLFSECQNAREKAAAAVNSGERTLQEARRTMSTLEAFDLQVQQSSEEAGRAVGQVSEISAKIGAAEQMTSVAKQQMIGSESATRAASYLTTQASATISQILSSLEELSTKGNLEQARANNYSRHSLDVENSVQSVRIETESYAKQMVEDRVLIEQLLQLVSRANASAVYVSEAARQALRLSRQLTTALAATNSLDYVAIDLLQRRLEAVEESLSQAQIGVVIEDMINFRSFQSRMVRSYEEDLLYLRQEISIIEEIYYSLPEQCYTKLNFEP